MLKDYRSLDYSPLWKKFITEGSYEALSLIYFNHYNLLFNYGLKYTGDRQIIEDSIQNIFSYFLKVRKNLHNVNNIPGFLIKCFRHQLFTELKSQRRLLLTEEFPDELFNYSNSPEENLIDQEESSNLQRTINECISNLSGKQQEMLYLRFESELSYEEISEILEITVDSCYKSVYRSIKAIREEVEKALHKAGRTNISF